MITYIFLPPCLQCFKHKLWNTIFNLVNIVTIAIDMWFHLMCIIRLSVLLKQKKSACLIIDKYSLVCYKVKQLNTIRNHIWRHPISNLGQSSQIVSD